MNIDEQERIDAVNRYLKSDKPSNVCRDVNRSEKWLFKWINRFKTGEVEWYTSHSRAPKKHGRKTEDEVDGGGQINLLNEVFEVGTEFTGEYVWATICLKEQKVEVYYQAQDKDVAMLIKIFSYEISEEIKTRQDVWKI